ncbi:hypothetical protein [Methylacidiphilum caldifontis]|uniref:Uncharacterized protein n=1 Tax=Methylacidiphilum caldifontis TaxID=2795386 RepID=A0A4Y8PGG7_9BACT|nr:hypothetical protein [Methylacidiphilum caldifontis]TFE71476.1 hypothetical protein A7Q10_10910 [Methylacidiphilum caldifontis]
MFSVFLVVGLTIVLYFLSLMVLDKPLALGFNLAFSLIEIIMVARFINVMTLRNFFEGILQNHVGPVILLFFIPLVPVFLVLGLFIYGIRNGFPLMAALNSLGMAVLWPWFIYTWFAGMFSGLHSYHLWIVDGNHYYNSLPITLSYYLSNQIFWGYTFGDVVLNIHLSYFPWLSAAFTWEAIYGHVYESFVMGATVAVFLLPNDPERQRKYRRKRASCLNKLKCRWQMLHNPNTPPNRCDY